MSLTDDKVLETLRKYPSQQRISASEIAGQIGCHLNTVKKAYRRLEAAGKIRRTRERRGQKFSIEILDA